MYRHGEQIRKRRRRHELYIGGALLLIGAIYLGLRLLPSDTQISKPPKAVVTSVATNPSKLKHFEETNFSFNLPSDWIADGHVTTPFNEYTWQNNNPADGKATRALNIYLDTIPPLAVNRFLGVQANGNRLIVLNTVSDNCTSFTRPSKSDPNAAAIHGKWNGLDFTCDLGNYIRDVVGTGSTDGINTISLTGPTTGKHSLFFVYTDNTPQPNYNIFTTALSSFVLK